MNFQKLLNERQYEAVTTASQNVRIIAGAGSGKTRVLTYRIAFLVEEMKVRPWNILAITFTNKVANEMRERAKTLIPEDMGTYLKVMTFHSFCARFLREEITNIGYPSTFTILDEDDQKRLMKTIASEEGYQKSDEIIKLSLAYLSNKKMLGLYPDDDIEGKIERFPREKECRHLWSLYESRLAAMFMLDFDDLLLKAIQILRDFPSTRIKWQDRYQHILIDEFQDTNDVQFQLLTYLLKPTTALYVVGDPDQTIYTWRGANQNIILDIDKRFPSLETIILDRNYRSTQSILEAANQLIDNNKKRVKKDLFTENEKGNPVVIKRTFSGDEEASWVADQINGLKAIDPEFSYKKVALLYRSSYLTLPFETAFTNRHIPYVIYGGIRFYQRKEIKDVVAYWHLLINAKDDISFERVVNVPRRNVGEKSLALLKDEARKNEYSLLEYLLFYKDEFQSSLREKLLTSLTSLAKTIDFYAKKLVANQEIFSDILREYIREVGYFDYLVEDKEEGAERLENIEALFSDALNYIKNNQDGTFIDYLNNITLQSAQDEMGSGDFVSLMTVHTAKGLEYPYVFVVGLNEGVFPSNRSLEENGYIGLEEERRLCYVAFTRAEKRLYLSCNADYSYVLQAKKIPSRFFKEAKLDFEIHRHYHSSLSDDTPLFTERKFNGVSKPEEKRVNGETWQKGDYLYHKVFGRGRVIEVIDNSILDVDFETVGRKRMMANHPSLEKVKNEGDLS